MGAINNQKKLVLASGLVAIIAVFLILFPAPPPAPADHCPGADIGIGTHTVNVGGVNVTITFNNNSNPVGVATVSVDQAFIGVVSLKAGQNTQAFNINLPAGGSTTIGPVQPGGPQGQPQDISHACISGGPGTTTTTSSTTTTTDDTTTTTQDTTTTDDTTTTVVPPTTTTETTTTNTGGVDPTTTTGDSTPTPSGGDQKPQGDVKGISEKSQPQAAARGELAFTGVPLWYLALLGATLASGGFYARRALRDQG